MTITLDQAEQLFDATQELAGSAFDFMLCQDNQALMPTVLQHVQALRYTLKQVGLKGFNKPESGEAVKVVDDSGLLGGLVEVKS